MSEDIYDGDSKPYHQEKFWSRRFQWKPVYVAKEHIRNANAYHKDTLALLIMNEKQWDVAEPDLQDIGNEFARLHFNYN